jgi:hypothetical protein
VAPSYERYPDTLVRAETAVPAAGRVWAVTGRANMRLDVANTTTGRVAFGTHDGQRNLGVRGLGPTLSADAYVAVIVAPDLVRVIEPDPLADGALAVGALDAPLLMPHADHHGGPLTTDSRVLCSGGTIFVVRLRPRGSSGAGGVTVSVFARLDPPGSRALRFMFVDRTMPLLPGVGELYVTALEDHHDGLLVAGASTYRGAEGAHVAGALWVPGADRGNDRDSAPAPWQLPVQHWRRAPPARVGPWLLLPDDQGGARIPLQRP